MPDPNFPIWVPVEILEQSSTPAAPPAGTMIYYPKTDDKLYQQTPGGVESLVGGSGGGSKAFSYFVSG